MIRLIANLHPAPPDYLGEIVLVATCFIIIMLVVVGLWSIAERVGTYILNRTDEEDPKGDRKGQE